MKKPILFSFRPLFLEGRVLFLLIALIQPFLAISAKVIPVRVSKPTIRLVPVFAADNRAHRLCFQRNGDENGYTAGMGGVFPLYEFFIKGISCQVSAAGSTYLTLLRKNHSGSVNTTDFFGDIWADFQLKPVWFLRLGTGHTSQHLSDDALLSGQPFKNYARDYHQAMVIYKSYRKDFCAYSGLLYNYNYKTDKDISGKIQFQLGLQHSLFRITQNGSIYYAGDYKWRQEYKAGTVNLQVGYKINKTGGRVIRLAINQTTGTDERGYYQPEKRSYIHGGIYLEL